MNDHVLVIAAHPDDEVLGCGGTISRMTDEGRIVDVLFLADGESSRKTNSEEENRSLIEARQRCAHAAGQILGCSSLSIKQFPDNRLDGVELLELVKIIEGHIDSSMPSTILTHHSGDINIDHRIIHEAVLAACRPQPGHCVNELLFFEIPSSTEWRPTSSGMPFQPSFFVDISATLPRKIEALKAYQSELRPFPHPRSLEAIESLARWRGATVGIHAAEAFILGRKIIR